MSNLNIIDEEGNIIGEDTRENIHKRGLLHREIHVWFCTPKGEIIFQLRGKHKDTFPNLLDATVGGHVELDGNFVDTALKEVFEETGLQLAADQLNLIKKLRKSAKDPATGMINNVIRAIYAYRYEGKVEDLKVEGKTAQGFEAWPIDKLLKGLSIYERKRFIPSMLGREYLKIYKEIEKLLANALL